MSVVVEQAARPAAAGVRAEQRAGLAQRQTRGRAVMGMLAAAPGAATNTACWSSTSDPTCFCGLPAGLVPTEKCRQSAGRGNWAQTSGIWVPAARRRSAELSGAACLSSGPCTSPAQSSPARHPVTMLLALWDAFFAKVRANERFHLLWCCSGVISCLVAYGVLQASDGAVPGRRRRGVAALKVSARPLGP